MDTVLSAESLDRKSVFNSVQVWSRPIEITQCESRCGPHALRNFTDAGCSQNAKNDIKNGRNRFLED